MECRLAGETEVLGENLPQRHLCPSQDPTWLDPGLNPGRRGGKPATNRLSKPATYSLSYCAALWYVLILLLFWLGNFLRGFYKKFLRLIRNM
jgi:hypothetical protein